VKSGLFVLVDHLFIDSNFIFSLLYHSCLFSFSPHAASGVCQASVSQSWIYAVASFFSPFLCFTDIDSDVTKSLISLIMNIIDAVYIESIPHVVDATDSFIGDW